MEHVTGDVPGLWQDEEGDRCRDLSVRLHYADVAHLVESDPLTAVHTAAKPVRVQAVREFLQTVAGPKAN